MGSKIDFKRSISVAIHNQNLKGALNKFSDAYLPSREKSYEGKDFDQLRKEISRIKGIAAEQMLEMADRFEREATQKGAVVYRAANGEEVKEYILQIARSRKAQTIVKSKSMATEEIHLNDFLQKQGIDVIETDLGEWILQLTGQKPSHMVMPAIHLSKEEIAEAFSKHLGRPVEADAKVLVKIAHEELRKAFLKADIGISGANIAVAETGTLALVSNEGNARLVTTLPPVHIAVVGYEKLVPELADVNTVLQGLPRSATGQHLTSYVSMISGAVPTTEDNQSKELHIILLDNGRLKMQADPVFRQALKCIRCCSCLNVCPVYKQVGGHVFGHTYAGSIGTILTAFLDSFEDAAQIQNLCMACGRCKDYCPACIDIPQMILELRHRLVQENGLPLIQKGILKGILKNPRLFHTLLRTAAKVQRPLTKGEPMIRHLPMFLSNLCDFRSLPAIAETPFRDKFPKIVKNPEQPKLKVGFYTGCVIDYAYPEIGEAVVRLLNEQGVAVYLPEEQSCCGAPATYLGDEETATELAKYNTKAFADLDLDAVITACPTCAEALKEHFPKLLAGDSQWDTKAQALAEKTFNFASLYHNLISEDQSEQKGEKVKVTYHDSCHLKRKFGVTEQPRELLQKHAGVELVEMKGSDICCGFGGSYCLKLPEISAQVLGDKIENIKDTGAEVVVVDCPGCLLQIRGGLDKAGLPVQVRHTAEILADKLNN